MKKQIISFEKDDKISKESKDKIFDVLKEEKAEKIEIKFDDDSLGSFGRIAGKI